MQRIKIQSSLEDIDEGVVINGIPLNEILTFLNEIDNGSFEQLTFLHKHHVNLIYLIEERGIIFPEYGHFITKITESPYAQLFNFGPQS